MNSDSLKDSEKML